MSLPISGSAASKSETMGEEGPYGVAGVREGQVLAGKYRVEHFLAVGGMGAVVAAHHIHLDTKVAIKFLLPAMLGNEEAVARFAREARAVVKITNEHVARVFDVGTLDTGAPYMVMEFLQGSDLGTLLQERGPLEAGEAIEFVLQACEAIAEAHALGIIHRDLKPSNLFLVRRADGRQIIKVLDFGISKVTTLAALEPNITLTLASGVMGSPFYMSPEQIEASHTVDSRADIWALGVILYELLSGRMPFAGDTLPEISVRIATRPPPPLRGSSPSAPRDALQAVIFRCLEKDREKRYRNVAELALALLPLAREGSRASVRRIIDVTQSAAMVAGETPRPPVAEESVMPERRGLRGPRNKQAITRLVALVGMCVLAIVVAIVLMSGRPQLSSGESAVAPDIARPTITNPLPPPDTTLLAEKPLVSAIASPAQTIKNDRGTNTTAPRAPRTTTAATKTSVAVGTPLLASVGPGGAEGRLRSQLHSR